MKDKGQEVIAAGMHARLQEGTRHRRADKLLERMIAAWEGLQPDVDELKNSLVGVQELVDLVKRERVSEVDSGEIMVAGQAAETRVLLAQLVDAWDRMKADAGLVDMRHQFVEVQELVDRARTMLAANEPVDAASKPSMESEPECPLCESCRINHLEGDDWECYNCGKIFSAVTLQEDLTTDLVPRQRFEVLVVEPHEYLRRHIRETLQESARAGAPVLACTLTDNPEAVVGILEQNPHDVVLLAAGYSLGGSILLLREIKKRYPELPVLLSGVSTDQQYRIMSLKNGASGYLVTEAIGDELVDAIRTIVAGKTYTSKQMR